MIFLHSAIRTGASTGALLLDALKNGLWDGLLSLPVLFLAYLLMELLERSKKFNEKILHGYSRKAGPALGGLLGIVPTEMEPVENRLAAAPEIPHCGTMPSRPPSAGPALRE